MRKSSAVNYGLSGEHVRRTRLIEQRYSIMRSNSDARLKCIDPSPNWWVAGTLVAAADA